MAQRRTLSQHERTPGARPSAFAAAASLLIAATLSACQSMEDIDRKIDKVVRARAENVGIAPPNPVTRAETPPKSTAMYDTDPPTNNPDTDSLTYTPASVEPAAVLSQLSEYYQRPADPLPLELRHALSTAQASSREYLSAEEDYILTVIALLIERHEWGPRFFDTISAVVAGTRNGENTSALAVINELRATQRLPYGGEVEARLVTDAAYQLMGEVTDRLDTNNEIILNANVPLLRGAGLVARETLIQAERDVIYAARDFEDFRRELLFEIASDYFSLTNQLQGVYNQRRQLRNIQSLYRQQQALVNFGRVRPFELKNVEQRLLSARVDLLNAQDNYKLALDRFKIRLGLNVSDAYQLIPVTFSLNDPDASIDEASAAALAYRLDYQNEIDQVNDAERAVRIAKNNLLPDLDLTVSTTNRTSRPSHDSVSFDFDDTEYEAGILLDLPLDRQIEKLDLRRATILLERARRDLDLFRDNLILDARRALRDIKQARYALQLQREAVEINELRIVELDLKRAEVDVQQRLDAIDDLLSSQNQLAQAESDLQVAILDFLLTTGQLRVAADGLLSAPAGMNIVVAPLLVEGRDISTAPYSVAEDFLDDYSEDPAVNPPVPPDPTDPAVPADPADPANPDPANPPNPGP